jgi:hypothetical protein
LNRKYLFSSIINNKESLFFILKASGKEPMNQKKPSLNSSGIHGIPLAAKNNSMMEFFDWNSSSSQVPVESVPWNCTLKVLNVSFLGKKTLGAIKPTPRTIMSASLFT